MGWNQAEICSQVKSGKGAGLLYLLWVIDCELPVGKEGNLLGEVTSKVTVLRRRRWNETSDVNHWSIWGVLGAVLAL